MANVVVDGVGNVIDGVGSVALTGLKFGQAAITSIADFSLRGAKEGLRLTKTVLKQIPVDKLKMTSANLNVMKKVNLRKLFQLRYGAETKAEEENDFGPLGDALGADESDEEALTDEKVQERVDKKFFDRNYDAMLFELQQLQAKYTDVGSKEHDDEKAFIEEAIKDRRQKCTIVGTTLKKRVLDNHQAFVNGIEHIQKVNEDLLATSAECTATRAKLHQSKNAVAVGGLVIPHLHRRRIHLCGVKEITEAMHDVTERYHKLLALIDEGSFVEAVHLIRAQKAPNPKESLLAHIDSMKPVMSEWLRLTTSDVTLLTLVDEAVSESLVSIKQFNERTYRNAMEASLLLQSSDESFRNVAQAIWRNTIQVLQRSLIEVSEVKDETLDVGTIAAHIAPDHLSLAICQMCGKMMDMILLFNKVSKCHLDQVELSTEHRNFHVSALGYLKGTGKKIGIDVGNKIASIVACTNLEPIELDKALHIFFQLSMLLEATVHLGLGKEELTPIRESMKASLNEYMQRSFHTKRSESLLSYMIEDNWEQPLGMPLSEERIVKPISGERFKSSRVTIKAYADVDIQFSGKRDNPFFTDEFMQAKDTSSMIELETIKDVAARDSTIVVGSHGGSPVVLGSTHMIGSLMMEYVARAVVRYPPLAAEVVSWCEELVCLYMYFTACNFVSMSQNVPVECQGEFSDIAVKWIRYTRESATRCAPQAAATKDPSGASLFPPRIRCDEVVAALYSKEKQFGFMQRCLAVEATQSLLTHLKATIGSVSALISVDIVEQRKLVAAQLAHCADEMLQVLMHRACMANLPEDQFKSDLSKMSPDSGPMSASACISRFIRCVEQLIMQKPQFPTKRLDEMYLKRLIFAAQTLMVKNYGYIVMNPDLEFSVLGNVSKKNLAPDNFVMRLSIDAQTFGERIQSSLPPNCIALPNFVTQFLNTAFIDDYERRKEWVRHNHTMYRGDDLANWLCASSRTKKKEILEVIKSCQHRDVLPIFK